jgi:hypothetical protein
MHAVLIVLAAVAIVGYVIGRQLIGEPMRGKRLIVLPLVLTVIGAANLHSSGRHAGVADVVCIAISVVVAAGIGLAQGHVMRLESRSGSLWAQLPIRGLWLWLALVASRVTIMVAATGLHAHVAASTATILLALGANRLGQAAVVTVRAVAAGIPFAPEKDGQPFLASAFSRSS